MGRMQKKAKKSDKAKKPKVQDVELLLEQGTDYLASQDYDKGLKKLRRAYQISPNDPEVAVTLGSALAETGNEAEAVQVLKHAVSLEPNEGHEKFMYLGQLLEGPDAVSCVKHGVGILSQLAAQEPELRPQLAEALCSLSELLLTSAEKVEEVAGECGSLVEQAAAADPASPQPLLALASLRNEESKPEEALALLRASLGKWMLAAPAEGSNDVSEALAAEVPSFEFRFETAKLLLDLDSTTEAAVRVLETLVADRDDLPDVWYMLALAYHGGCDFKPAVDCIERAHEALGKATGVDPREAAAKSADLEELRAAIMASAATMEVDLDEDEDEDEDEGEEDGEDEDMDEDPQELSYKEKLLVGGSR